MSCARTDLYHGIFEWQTRDGAPCVTPRPLPSPAFVPDPATGRRLRISTIQAGTTAICPSCSCHAQGGFVSFEDDLRIAYACPSCQRLVWIAGC